MSKVLWNPTVEQLVGTYDGNDTIVQPNPEADKGKMIKVDDSRANHLLTYLKKRGLTSLEFGDDDAVMEAKRERALSRQESYEKGHVKRVNIENQKAKHEHRVYNDPPPEIDRFALRWGIVLNEPYNLKDVEKEGIAKAEKRATEAEARSRKLEVQLAEVSSAVKELMLDKLAKDEINKLDKRTKEYKDKIKDLDED